MKVLRAVVIALVHQLEFYCAAAGVLVYKTVGIALSSHIGTVVEQPPTDFSAGSIRYEQRKTDTFGNKTRTGCPACFVLGNGKTGIPMQIHGVIILGQLIYQFLKLKEKRLLLLAIQKRKNLAVEVFLNQIGNVFPGQIPDLPVNSVLIAEIFAGGAGGWVELFPHQFFPVGGKNQGIYQIDDIGLRVLPWEHRGNDLTDTGEI